MVRAAVAVLVVAAACYDCYAHCCGRGACLDISHTAPARSFTQNRGFCYNAAYLLCQHFCHQLLVALLSSSLLLLEHASSSFVLPS